MTKQKRYVCDNCGHKKVESKLKRVQKYYSYWGVRNWVWKCIEPCEKVSSLPGNQDTENQPAEKNAVRYLSTDM